MRGKKKTKVVSSAAKDQPLLADGFEKAFVGYFSRCAHIPVAVYDYNKCVHTLMDRDGMTEEEAVEYMDFNVVGGWLGEGTPAFLIRCREEEFVEMVVE